MNQYRPTISIPDRQRKKLYAAIEQYAPLHNSRHRIPYGVPLSVKEMFPNSRMLLSCGRSKVQNTFDTPQQQRSSNVSEFSNSIWSNNNTISTTASTSNNNNGSTGRRLSGLWSSNTSTRSSNDSSTSLSTSLDVPLPTLPQYPGSVKLAGQGTASTSSLHTPPMSPTASKSRHMQHHHHSASAAASPRAPPSMSLQRHGSTRSNRSDVIRRAEPLQQSINGRTNSRKSSSSESSNSKDVCQLYFSFFVPS